MNKPTKVTFEQLLNGEVNQVSIINEPIDYTVNFAVDALAIARRRWRCEPELISREE